MSDQAGGTYTPLRSKCPRCGGILEREDKAKVPNPKPVIRCRDCGIGWKNYRAMCSERAQKDKREFKLPSLAKLKGYLQTGKVGARGARNVAARIRAASNLFREVADEVQKFGGQESVARMGSKFEGIIDQAVLAVEDVQEAKDGKLGADPDVEEKEVGE